ncbi:MAG: conserved hypothetical exported protein [Rhizobium sp.]|nr:conserved hypothetical exported protein [Rhizobium sp.]
MVLARLASLLLFGALGAYAVLLAAQDRNESYMLSVGKRLDLEQSVTIEQVGAAARYIMSPAFEHSCRSDILRPALTIVLYDLGRANRVSDYDGWVKANMATLAYLNSMIRCLPADGNVWLRDVLVSRAIAENPQSLHDKMAVSRALMPYEGPQLFARLFLWKRISPLALATSEDLARADISTVLLHGGDKLNAAMRDRKSPAFETLLTSEIKRIKTSAPPS